MGSVESYRKIIHSVFKQYAYLPSHGDIEVEVIIDAEQNHFEIMHVGWDGSRRVHGSVIHVDIIDGKVWIQHDGTSPGIALELLNTGIPQSDIVLAFRPAHVRQHTEYGVGVK